jgi:hypothetical protein
MGYHRKKKSKKKMKKEHFIAGIILLVLLGAGAWYGFTIVPKGLADTQKYIVHEQHTKRVYGTVVSVSPTSLTLEVVRHDGKKNFTFVMDENTVFVRLSSDEISTEIPFDKSTIAVGDSLNVIAREVIGSVENQYATKVVRN